VKRHTTTGRTAALLCTVGLLAGHAWGAEVVAPPLMYPAGLWQGRGQAVLRVLNRLDSHVETMTIGVDDVGHYKTLGIAVHRCLERPKTLPGDSAVQATITDTTPGGSGFDGWMIASTPSLSMLQNALYEVHVVGCAGPQLAPQLPPLTLANTQSTPPADTGAQGAGNAPANATGQPQAQTPGGAPVPLTSSGTAPTPLTPDSGPAQANATPAGTGAPAASRPSAPQSAGPAPTPLLPPEEDQPVAPAPQPSAPAPGSGSTPDDAPLPPPTPLVPGGN
jgi:hypothetical protein